MILIHIFEWLVFGYLAASVLYLLIFSIAGRFPLTESANSGSEQNKFAVLIPAYKEDQVIVQTAQQALNQSYAKKLYDVIVVADSLQAATLQRLRLLPVKLIEVAFEKSTKVKAINAALRQIPDDYVAALILDADNVMAVDFLEKMNAAMLQGSKVVQGHRVAKNMNTPMAKLDALSEEINNHIFRKGHRRLGLSAALIGSGMAFEFRLFKEMMQGIHAVSGFDKELELKLLKAGHQIEYLPSALVYDEKVQDRRNFSGQRRRWLAAQLIYLRKYFSAGISQVIVHKNIDFFDKVIQMLLPPRILLLGSVVLIASFSGLLQLLNFQSLFFSAFEWFSLVFFTAVALILSIPKSFFNKKMLTAVLYAPLGFWEMLRALLHMKNANKVFIHTEHGISKKSKKNGVLFNKTKTA